MVMNTKEDGAAEVTLQIDFSGWIEEVETHPTFGGTPLFICYMPLSHQTGKKVVIEITFPTKELSISCIFYNIYHILNKAYDYLY